MFAGTTYEADDEEADQIYEQVDQNMDARRRIRRSVPLVSFPSFHSFNMVLLASSLIEKQDTCGLTPKESAWLAGIVLYVLALSFMEHLTKLWSPYEVLQDQKQ